MLSHIWQKIENIFLLIEILIIFLLIEIFLESGTQPQCRHPAELRRWWRLRWWSPWWVVSIMTGWTRHLVSGHHPDHSYRETLMITWDVMMTRGSRLSLSWSSAVSKWTHKGSWAPGSGTPHATRDMWHVTCGATRDMYDNTGQVITWPPSQVHHLVKAHIQKKTCMSFFVSTFRERETLKQISCCWHYCEIISFLFFIQVYIFCYVDISQWRCCHPVICLICNHWTTMEFLFNISLSRKIWINL